MVPLSFPREKNCIAESQSILCSPEAKVSLPNFPLLLRRAMCPCTRAQLSVPWCCWWCWKTHPPSISGFCILYLICVEPNCLIGFLAYCLSAEAIFYLLLVLCVCTFTCTNTFPSSLITEHKSYQSLFLEVMVFESPSSRCKPFIPPGLW